MSSAFTASGRPSLPLRAVVLLGVPLMLAIGFVGSPFAQSAPGGYGPGAGPGVGHMGPPRSGEHRMPSPEAVEGPPSPATMRDSIDLSQDQLQRYSVRYSNHMAATRAIRDSVHTSMEAMRSAFESGDRSAARERHQAVERQWKDLSDRDKQFDESLKDLLTKDQQKRYKKWKEEREKAAHDDWRRNRRASHDGPGRERTFQVPSP